MSPINEEKNAADGQPTTTILAQAKPQFVLPITQGPGGGSTTVGTSPAQLNLSGHCYHRLLIQNDPSSTVAITVGTVGAQSISIAVGDSVVLEDAVPNTIWVSASSSGQQANWLGYGFHLSTEVSQ